MRSRAIAGLAAGLMSSCASFARAETVTSLGTPVYPLTPTWTNLNTSGGSATITTDQPRNGTGSLRLETNGSGEKAAATYGGTRFGGPTLGTFGDLLNGSIGFDFYRDSSSTAGAHLAPALEISFGNGSNLKWEAVYDGFPVVSPISTDTWYSVNFDATHGLFYQFKTGGVVTNAGGAQQNLTMQGWLDSTLGNDFTFSTEIKGISIQAGSGWGGKFVGYVDNVSLNLPGTANDVVANFEPPTASEAATPLPVAGVGGAVLLSAMGFRRGGRRRLADRV